MYLMVLWSDFINGDKQCMVCICSLYIAGCENFLFGEPNHFYDFQGLAIGKIDKW